MVAAFVVNCRSSQKQFTMTKLQQEIWKDIPGYEGRYKVSTFGYVIACERTYFAGVNNRSAIHSPEKAKKFHINEDGYPVIGLFDGKKEKKFKVHKIVALAFIPNPENKPEVNHKDGNKLNNSINNLEWVTHAENMEHWVSSGLLKNRRQYIRKPAVLSHKKCPKCKMEKPAEDFAIRRYKTGELGRKTNCKKCDQRSRVLRYNLKKAG